MKILITFDTISNSTKKTASIIKEVLSSQIEKDDDTSVDLKLYNEVENLDDYDFIVIGSPMRFKNFNSKIQNFIFTNKKTLKNKKVFFFLTCLYLIETTANRKYEFPVFIDPSFDAHPKPLNKMNIMDKTHSNEEYVRTILSNSVSPESIAFFKGKLDLKSLGLVSRIFMKIITIFTKKEQVGDFLNPESVKIWAQDISALIKT